MPGPRSRLPSLDDGVAFAKSVARVLSQMTGDPYGEPALSELEAGKEKSEQGLGNPVAFAHTVIDWYAQAAGDFLYGTGEVSRESYNLALSSAAVARSACEYAGIGWWLAEPGIPIESRIARTARLVITTHNEGKSLLDSSEIAQYESQVACGGVAEDRRGAAQAGVSWATSCVAGPGSGSRTSARDSWER
jgi:hypothetical protein